jgi:hypothetical protein
MPWLRLLVAGLSPQRPEFAPGSVHVGFVMDTVALGQAFLLIIQFPPHQYYSTMAVRTHVLSRGWTICLLVATVQRHSLTPSALTRSPFINSILRVIVNKQNWGSFPIIPRLYKPALLKTLRNLLFVLWVFNPLKPKTINIIFKN